MKKTVLFLFILSSFIACKSKDDSVNPTVVNSQTQPALVIVKESLGTRTLSWIKPYLGKSSVTFEDSLGNKQIFDITETPIRREFHTYTYIADGETFELFLTQKTDKNNIFSFKPLGKNFIIFSNLDRISETTPNIVNLQFARFYSEENYWVTYSGPLSLQNLIYTYSPTYPIEGGDFFTFSHDKNTQTFYKSFAMTQSKGIEYYIDDKNVKWKQVSVK
jgi:hypothetical protein